MKRAGIWAPIALAAAVGAIVVTVTVVVDEGRATTPHRPAMLRLASDGSGLVGTEPARDGGVAPGASDFIVILTRCHALDEGVLEAALRTPARYIGLIGSRRKVALILRSIAKRLGRDPRDDPRLHAPIGLRLGDKTPGEIAISILAEILLLKSKGELAHSRLAPKDAVRVRA